MASGSDVRAGRAYVELGTKDSALIAGLRAAMKRVRAFAEEAQAVGRNMMLFGAGLTTALVAVASKFAGAGVALAKIQKQTGLSAEALSGLAQAASDNEVEINALQRSLTHLQRSLAGGSEETARALEKLGLSLDEARAMPFADLLGTIADRLPVMGDEVDRVAASTALFGKSGAELLPVLAAGSAGLNDAAKRARELGTALDEDALRAAGELDDAFDSLSGAMTGLRNAAGQAIAGALVPLVEAVSRVVTAVGEWIRQNPETVQTILRVSVAVGVLGAAVAALATVVLALTSPLVLTIALLAGIAAGALAVTDALGVTSTGFGDLFNSIRVGGQGLATWLAKLWSYVVEGWSVVVFSIESLFDGLWTAVKGIATGIRDAFVAITQPIADAFGPFFTWLRDAFDTAFGWIVDGLKKLVGWIADAFSWLWNNTVGLLLEADKGDPTTGEPGFAERQQQRRSALDEALAAQQRTREELDRRDPDDGTSGVRFDADRAKKALADIGKNITDAIAGTVDQVVQRERSIAKASEPFAGAEPHTGASLAAETAEHARKVDVATTFSAAFAGRLGVGTTVEERQARAAEQTTRNTAAILEELRTNGAAAAVYGA